ncbi:MAG TPA: hypothetical protein VJ924_11920 [Alphaproteobacteria bacterium]|nr:hypothetical protein [Alphaproteobacteria bacterium]
MISLSIPGLEEALGRIGGAGNEIAAASGEMLQTIAEALREEAVAHLDASASAESSGALGSSLAVGSRTANGAPIAYVFSDQAYAAVQEYGFAGVVGVAEHLRRVREAFGRPIRSERLARVRTHTRRMIVPAKRFLGQAVDDLQRSNRGVRR